LQLLTVEEAAQRLSVGRSRMYELVESGKVPAKRLSGRRIRISEAELERYIDGLERV
jgi:excisionase family DNA binding protein